MAFAFRCSIPSAVAALSDQASEMEKKLEHWKKEVDDKRRQFYELNYFTTPQLLSLCEELGQFKCVDDQHKPIKSEVMTLLQSISREVTANNVKEQVQSVCAISQEQSLEEAQLLGSPKHSPSIVLSSQPNVYCSLATLSMEDNNDDNRMSGMKSKVFEDIMKTEIASNAPEPLLKDEELTRNQIAIIANVKHNCGLPKKLIMLAFERCAKPDIREEVEEWCVDHQSDFDYPDSEADSEVDSDAIHSDDEEEKEKEVKIEKDAPIDTPPMEIEPEVQQKPVKVRFIERVSVDENHPGVIELHNTGFDLDLCIEANTRYPHDISLALDYLHDRSDQGKLFEVSPTPREVVISDNGMGLEESTVEEAGYERQDSRESDISR